MNNNLYKIIDFINDNNIYEFCILIDKIREEKEDDFMDYLSFKDNLMIIEEYLKSKNMIKIQKDLEEKNKKK